jgi:hypothetical protein
MALYSGISIGISIHLGALCYQFIACHYYVTLVFLGAWLHFLVMLVIICIIHEVGRLVNFTTRKECFVGLILVEYSYGLIDCIWLFVCMLGMTPILLTIFGVDTLSSFKLTLNQML